MSKYIRWQILLTLSGIMLIAASLLYIGHEPRPTPTPTLVTPRPVGTVMAQLRGGTYIEGVAGTPLLINPLFSHFNDLDRDLCALIFEGLTRVNERNEIIPSLAERWEISEDGLTYTFFLRQDVRWQDGRRFTADDVTFTIKLLQSPEMAGFHPHAALWHTVTVEQPDRFVVRFKLTEPFAPFLDYTTIGILPWHILNNVPPAQLIDHPFNYAPIGTGLFQVQELVMPDHITLKVNPYHRRWSQAMLDAVQFKFYPTFHDAWQGYQAGQVMGVARISTQDLDQARSNPNIQVLSAQTSGYTLVLFNLNHPDRPFFQDRRVRQALLYALNRQAAIDRVLGGQAVVIHSPIMPQSWAFDPDVQPYPYDPDMAVSLLEQAGYELANASNAQTVLKDGYIPVRAKKDRELTFTLLTDSDPDHIAVAQDIARQWAEVGARVSVTYTDMLDLVQNHLQPRLFDAVLVQWPYQLDPDLYPMWHETQVGAGGQNYSGFANRDASEAIEIARQLTDRGKRTELYYQFQDIFVSEVPAILLYQPIYTYGVDRRVRNVQIVPMVDPSGRFANLWQWAPNEKSILLRDWNDQVVDKLDKRRNSWYDLRHP